MPRFARPLRCPRGSSSSFDGRALDMDHLPADETMVKKAAPGYPRDRSRYPGRCNGPTVGAFPLRVLSNNLMTARRGPNRLSIATSRHRAAAWSLAARAPPNFIGLPPPTDFDRRLIVLGECRMPGLGGIDNRPRRSTYRPEDRPKKKRSTPEEAVGSEQCTISSCASPPR